MPQLNLPPQLAYLVAPLAAWLTAGTLKFIINRLRAKDTHNAAAEARSLIGNGGMPSNHTTIVFTMVFLTAFREGWGSPFDGIALTVAATAIIDAMDLRIKTGRHAAAINQLIATLPDAHKPANWKPLRERMGHTPPEVFGGILTALAVATALNLLFAR